MKYPIIVPTEVEDERDMHPDKCVMYVYNALDNSIIIRKIVRKDDLELLFGHYISMNNVVAFTPINKNEESKIFDFHQDDLLH